MPVVRVFFLQLLLLAVFFLPFCAELVAQNNDASGLDQPVYRAIPLQQQLDGYDAANRRMRLFSDAQPPLQIFTWRTPTSRLMSTPAAQPTVSAIQQASYQVEATAARTQAAPGAATTTAAVLDATTPAAEAPPAAGPPAAGAKVESDVALVTTAAVVETKIKKVEESAVADEVKATAQKHHQQSIEYLRLADEAAQKAAKLKAEIEGGPAAIEDLRKQLAEPPEKIEGNVPLTATVADLESLRLADEGRLLEAKKAVDIWEAKATTRNERRPQMPAMIEKTTKQLAEARQAASASETGEPIVVEARRTEQQARIKLLEQQVDLYQIENARYGALNELFPLQHDLVYRQKSQLEKRLEFWKTAILNSGKRESARQAAEAKKALQDALPALRDLAEKNAKLTEQRSQLQTCLAKTNKSLNEIKSLADATKEDFKDAKDKETRVGLTTAIGILLRNQRAHLPDEGFYRQKCRDAEAAMAKLQIEQMPLEDERRKLGEPSEVAEQLVADLAPSDANHEDIRAMAVGMLTDRKTYLDDAWNDYEKCIKDLAELDISCRTLADTSVEFRNYIDARVLWISSADVAGPETLRKSLAGLKEIAAAVDVTNTSRAVSAEATGSPVRSMLVVVVIGLILGMQSRFRRWISSLSKRGSSKSGPGMVSTLVAFGLTLLIASVWPGMIWFVGRRLCQFTGNEFAIACGVALKTTAIVFWSVEAFRQMCRSNGIAERHLNWPVATVRGLHARLVGLMVSGLPFVFAVRFVESWKEAAWSESLGRMLFVVGMFVLAIGLRRIVRPSGPVFRNLLEEHSSSWVYRTRYIWSLAIIAAPVALAGLSIAGFHYTAEQLLVRVEATALLFIALMMAFGLLIRRMNMARRNLAINQARERRAAAEAAAEAPSGSGGVVAELESRQIDFGKLSGQVLKLSQIAVCALFASGAWLVWAEVLPALQVFDQVELWSTLTEVQEEVEITEGVTKTMLVSHTSPVTLGSFLLAVGILSLFMLASRNIPGLLELSVLQHLPMDDGGRNAITTLCRYALFTTGILLAANMIGIDWESVSWLLAALTVGLGFGLQEIFANFVSGLIILFERPVRIGDIVTIDSVSGTVSRIQIRATTITDFDRKEYIVPNKEFVTGRVLNWTLSDKTNRIKIDVGVAYGNDTVLARTLLVKVAKANARVMEAPEPIATFEGFGDSCLMLSLRCYIPGLDDRLQVITDLHEAIDHEFKQQGLEIAFPQQDIHIRSMTAIPAAAATFAQGTDQESREAA